MLIPRSTKTLPCYSDQHHLSWFLAIPCSDQRAEKVILILIKYGFIILKTIKFYCQLLRGEDVLLISGGPGESQIALCLWTVESQQHVYYLLLLLCTYLRFYCYSKQFKFMGLIFIATKFLQ